MIDLTYRALLLACSLVLWAVPAAGQAAPAVAKGDWVRLELADETLEARVLRVGSDSLVVQEFLKGAPARTLALVDVRAAWVSRYTKGPGWWGPVTGTAVGAAVGTAGVVLWFRHAYLTDDGPAGPEVVTVVPLGFGVIFASGALGYWIGKTIAPPGRRHRWQPVSLQPAVVAGDGRVGVALRVGF